ncbi:hypothetical protein ACNF40_05305 [Cuniculiplasma sp. SKW4]|uniref:hypothetical protein n=1 Tax=Cuniculiplasma sp. SKW4 TaxID=3400171 RepID=UPI003FD5B20A
MKTSFYKKSKALLSDFSRTVSAQFTKDVIYLFRSLYAPAVVFVSIILLSFILYEGNAPVISTSFWALKYSLGSNIMSLGMGPFLSVNFGWILMLIPALNISDDIESRNFEILRTFKFNSPGYYLGKILSSMFYVLLSLLIIAYIVEGALFYDGYAITSKFLIEPIYVALASMAILLPIFGISILVSSLLGNKMLSVFTILSLFFFISIATSDLGTILFSSTKISLFNTFLFSLNTFYSSPVASGLLGMSIRFSSVHLTYQSLLYVISLSVFIFLLLGYIVIFFRKNYVRFQEKITLLLSTIVSRDGKNEEE